MTAQPKCLVVQLEADLPQYRINGLLAAFKQHPGVECVADMSAISQATLDLILRKPDAVQPAKRRGKKSA